MKIMTHIMMKFRIENFELTKQNSYILLKTKKLIKKKNSIDTKNKIFEIFKTFWIEIITIFFLIVLLIGIYIILKSNNN